MAKKQQMNLRPSVRISSEKPNAVVKFKVLRGSANDPELVRATCRGEKPIFIRHGDNGWKAGVRGDTPVAAKDPGQAFSRAVKNYWG